MIEVLIWTLIGLMCLVLAHLIEKKIEERERKEKEES